MKKCPTCLRPLTFGKTHEQRKFFHKICDIVGQDLGLTPGQVKAWIKQEHFGIDEFKVGNKWVRTIQSSEDTDRPEYTALIETAIRVAAEAGVVIEDTQ